MADLNRAERGARRRRTGAAVPVTRAAAMLVALLATQLATAAQAQETAAQAQEAAPTSPQVLLETPAGGVSVSGRLLSYAHGVYTIATGLGELTLAADALRCSGPACPDRPPPAAAETPAESAEGGVTLRSRSGSVRLRGLIQAHDARTITIATVAGPVTVPLALVQCAGEGCPQTGWPRLAEAAPSAGEEAPDMTLGLSEADAVDDIGNDADADRNADAAPVSSEDVETAPQDAGPQDAGPQDAAPPDDAPRDDGPKADAPAGPPASGPEAPAAAGTAPRPAGAADPPADAADGPEPAAPAAPAGIAPPARQVVVAGPDFAVDPLLPALAAGIAGHGGLQSGSASALPGPEVPVGTRAVPLTRDGGAAEALLVARPAATAAQAQALLDAGAADGYLWPLPTVATGASDGGGPVVAHDALVALVHPDNPVRGLTLAQLRAVIAGQVPDWTELDGAPGPVTLVGLPADHPLSGLRDAMLLANTGIRAAVPLIQVETVAALAAEVARDPAAIGLGTLALAAPARALPLVSDCGFALPADATTVRTGAYPLGFSIALTAAPRDPLAEAALAALQTPDAAAGLIAAGMEPGPLSALQARLETALAESTEARRRAALEQALENVAVSRRLPVEIRFQAGSNRLTPEAEAALARVADFAAERQPPELFLIGHAEDAGDPVRSLELSRLAARLVRQMLARLDDGGRMDGTLVRAVGLGALAPESCGADAGGAADRRVEVWVRG